MKLSVLHEIVTVRTATAMSTTLSRPGTISGETREAGAKKTDGARAEEHERAGGTGGILLAGQHLRVRGVRASDQVACATKKRRGPKVPAQDHG
jgi:hypothetical protein